MHLALKFTLGFEQNQALFRKEGQFSTPGDRFTCKSDTTSSPKRPQHNLSFLSFPDVYVINKPAPTILVPSPLPISGISGTSAPLSCCCGIFSSEEKF
jgi:hypothetical protein